MRKNYEKNSKISLMIIQSRRKVMEKIVMLQKEAQRNVKRVMMKILMIGWMMKIMMS